MLGPLPFARAVGIELLPGVDEMGFVDPVDLAQVIDRDPQLPGNFSQGIS